MAARQFDSHAQTHSETHQFDGTVILNGLVKAGADNAQLLTGAGAVGVTTLVTKVVTTGAQALTLADGAEGQLKIISMITDGGDGTLTPTNLTPGSTITFNDAGDTVVLLFLAGEWRILANQGCTLG